MSCERQGSSHHGGALDLDGFCRNAGLFGGSSRSLLFGGKVGQKLLASSLEVEPGGVHPRMRSQLLNCRSLVSIEGEQGQDKVFELGGEVASVDFGEVVVSSALQEQVVEVLFLAGLFEGENSLHDNEEDNPDGEHVNLGALILTAFFNFGCHVGHRSAVGLQSVNALVAGETEIGNFEVE